MRQSFLPLFVRLCRSYMHKYSWQYQRGRSWQWFSSWLRILVFFQCLFWNGNQWCVSELFDRSELHEISWVLDFDWTRDTDVDHGSLSCLLDVWRIIFEQLLELEIFQCDFGFLPFVAIQLSLSSKHWKGLCVLVVTASDWYFEGSKYVLVWGLFDDDLLWIDADGEVLVHFWDQVVKQLPHLAYLCLLLCFWTCLDLFWFYFWFLFLYIVKT